MNKEVQKYVEWLSKQKVELEGTIATKKRSLEIVMSKLSNPEHYLNLEKKRGAVKVSKVLGVETVQKPKTVLKKKSDEIEKIEIPTNEMNLSGAPAAAAPKKDEDSFGGFFG